MKQLKIPFLFVAAHTALLLITAGAVFVSLWSHNPDSSIGFAMMCITCYMVDYPIGQLLEAVRPSVPDWTMVTVMLLLYVGLANAMWFLVGLLVSVCLKPFKAKSPTPSQ